MYKSVFFVCLIYVLILIPVVKIMLFQVQLFYFWKLIKDFSYNTLIYTYYCVLLLSFIQVVCSDLFLINYVISLLSKFYIFFIPAWKNKNSLIYIKRVATLWSKKGSFGYQKKSSFIKIAWVNLGFLNN